jgi:hypothetical protein
LCIVLAYYNKDNNQTSVFHQQQLVTLLLCAQMQPCAAYNWLEVACKDALKGCRQQQQLQQWCSRSLHVRFAAASSSSQTDTACMLAAMGVHNGVFTTCDMDMLLLLLLLQVRALPGYRQQLPSKHYSG